MRNEATYAAVSSRYGTLTIFANDSGAVTQSLLKYGEWAENELGFLRTFISRGNTVIDAGAYIGTHTLAFARFTGEQGRVISIEAQPDSFELLRKNVTGNVQPGIVQVENAIASCEITTVSIPTIDVERESSFGSASIADVLNHPEPHRVDELAYMRSATVRALTIDSLELTSCALIKIDVEGVEDMVLRGALRTLERCSPVVYCECNTIAGGLKTMSVLEGARYKIFAHVVNAFNPDNFLNNEENIFGRAREVALVGFPAGGEHIRDLPVRPFELLLDIEDADDLALALLNKPQYPHEVLLVSRAAASGGRVFFDELNAEVERLQRDIGEIHQQLAQRDGTVAVLQQELGESHGLLSKRNDDFAALQVQVGAKTLELAELQESLRQRDTDIARLQAEQRESLEQQEMAIAHLRTECSAKDVELAGTRQVISEIYASRSWKAAQALRRLKGRFSGA